MSDDLDDLKTAMRSLTPAPNTARKASDLALAQKNFADLQESSVASRQASQEPKTGFVRGVVNLISQTNTRGALTATTALVALGLVVVVPEWQRAPGLRGPQPVATEADFTGEASHELGEVAEVSQPEPASAAAPGPVTAPEEVLSLDGVQSRPMANSRAKAAENQGLAELQSFSVEDEAQGTLTRIAPEHHAATLQPEVNTEAFPEVSATSLKITAEEPVSTFSIDVDTASYAVVRSSLNSGQLPPKTAVRVEEMVNYFPYDYPAPEGGKPFQPIVTVTDTPWNAETQLVHIAIQGESKSLTERAPLNLVFLIDTSGSMNAPAKLPLLKQSLALMLPELTEHDSVAIVAYAGSAGQVLEPTRATERVRILEALDRLDAGGSTAGQAGLQHAYALAETMAKAGEISRVLLVTDGDFNVGISEPGALKEFIADKRDTGTYLSVLGFGRGNLDDATMQALAQNGNGQAAYIDTLGEAQKVLVDQLSGVLYPIANDVKIQVEFNPAAVAEYRLIGYETRALAREDFSNDRVDAGDVGVGHQVTALYEITPMGSPARLSDPLRYGEVAVAGNFSELGYFKLRYKRPGQAESQLTEQPIEPGGLTGLDARFAVAIAGFAQLLRGEVYLGDWDYDAAIELANVSRGDDAFGYRAEAVQLMRLAQSLSR